MPLVREFCVHCLTTARQSSIAARIGGRYPEHMTDAETLAKLKALYQALSERPLDPDDAAYADLYTDGTLSEPNIVTLMAAGIEFAQSETAQLLGGQRGTGKSTLLRALKQRLEQNRSYKVVICNMEGYLPMTDPVDVVDFLLVAAVALSEALAVPELLGKDLVRESAWSHLISKSDLSFRERTHEQAKDLINTFRDDVHAFMRECLLALRKHHGENTHLVVIFDGMEHIRGLTSNADAVADSIERLFRSHVEAMRIPLIHVVFTVPPWLQRRFPISYVFDNYYQVPCVKVCNHPDNPGHPQKPNPAGIETLRKLVQKRGENDWLDWLLGSPEAFDELALASGGHLRDLFIMLRTVLIDAHEVGVPVSEHQRRRAIEELRGSYDLGLTNQDAALLRRVDETGTLALDLPVHRVGTFLEQFLLFYRNGNGWYGVRPVIRADVLRRASVWDESQYLQGSPEEDAPKVVPAVRVAGIELEQIRCFDHVIFDFERKGASTVWILLLGDNAHGKSTLLRAIALGLCAESEVAALVAATSGPLLRYGQNTGRITVTLTDTGGKRYRSVTEVTRDTEGEPGAETLRRVEWELSVDQVFVCAYGANRTRTADLSHSGYSRHDAVRSLFDDETSLQNSELILRRQGNTGRQRVEQKLLEILMLDPKRGGIQYSSTHGLQIRGPWASGDWVLGYLSTLSDGYRSTTQWVIDLIGWLVYAGRFARDEDITGVVLIDELEQHLHPRWQRCIIAQLHTQFPRLQFIVSTHTPLLALGLADQERGLLVQLSKDDEQNIRTKLVDPHDFRGLRADQVLTSHKGFALPTTRSPGSSDDIARYTELASKQRSEAEEQDYAKLGAQLDETLVLGETPYERRVEIAVRKVLATLAAEPLEQIQEYELRRKLADLFAEKTPV
jgi:energy-coupling factor transporter ATP-binding protein EcfA2